MIGKAGMMSPPKNDDGQVCGAGGWLALAAAPTFAVMAWLVTGSMAICASGSGMPPLDGMAWMYLLMGLFHLPPWLKLVSRRNAAAHPFQKQTEGD